MLKTIEDFIQLERKGYSPIKQWNTLLKSPSLLNKLNNEPKNIVNFLPSWDKKLKFVELSQSENCDILIFHISSKIDYTFRSSLNLDSLLNFANLIEKTKTRYGMVILKTKNLNYLNSTGIGILLKIWDIFEKEKSALLFTEMPPKLNSVIQMLELTKCFKFIDPLEKFLEEVYYTSKQEKFIELEMNPEFI